MKLSVFRNQSVTVRATEETGVIQDAYYERGKDSSLGVRFKILLESGREIICQPGEVVIDLSPKIT